SGDDAAIRVVSGIGLAKIGMDGPVRVDGVINKDASRTVRGEWRQIVADALSLYVKDRAAALGIPIDAGHAGDLDSLVSSNLGGYDSYLVLFMDEGTMLPGRRAGASSGQFDLNVEGTGGFTFQKQLHARIMIGEGSEIWQTWAHEMGHNLGFW